MRLHVRGTSNNKGHRSRRREGRSQSFSLSSSLPTKVWHEQGEGERTLASLVPLYNGRTRMVVSPVGQMPSHSTHSLPKRNVDRPARPPAFTVGSGHNPPFHTIQQGHDLHSSSFIHPQHSSVALSPRGAATTPELYATHRTKR